MGPKSTPIKETATAFSIKEGTAHTVASSLEQRNNGRRMDERGIQSFA